MTVRTAFALWAGLLVSACTAVGPDYAGPPATTADATAAFPSSAPAGAAVPAAIVPFHPRVS